jgi:2-amino-4-hydroxy-6-hydroxymethyldihydropteridine diphosphokinase
LRGTIGVKVGAISEFYDTKAVGGPPQPDYLNGVLEAETDLSPEECLRSLKKIENEMGRATAERDHPRIIDIDILLFDESVINTSNLDIPHPRMHERHFVLRGLSEIAPDVVHPLTGKTARELYESCHKDPRDEGLRR